MQFMSRLFPIYSPFTTVISWDIQVGKSSYHGSDGLMKRSMEAKHLIEDTTSVFFLWPRKTQVGRFPLGGDVFLLVFFDSLVFPWDWNI